MDKEIRTLTDAFTFASDIAREEVDLGRTSGHMAGSGSKTSNKTLTGFVLKKFWWEGDDWPFFLNWLIDEKEFNARQIADVASYPYKFQKEYDEFSG